MADTIVGAPAAAPAPGGPVPAAQPAAPQPTPAPTPAPTAAPATPSARAELYAWFDKHIRGGDFGRDTAIYNRIVDGLRQIDVLLPNER